MSKTSKGAFFGVLTPWLPMLGMLSGCAGPRHVSPDCVIERPNEDVILEQLHEAERAQFSKDGPILPATYEYLKRLDRDIHLFGDPE